MKLDHYLIPVLVSASAVGVLSQLPLLEICCCLWWPAAGVIPILWARRGGARPSLFQGALVGFVTGVATACVATAVAVPRQLLMMRNNPDFVDQYLAMVRDMTGDPAVAELMESMLTGPSFIIAVLFTYLFVGSFAGSISAAVTALAAGGRDA